LLQALFSLAQNKLSHRASGINPTGSTLLEIQPFLQ